MPPSLVPVEEMLSRLDRALASSPADETELVWIEARRSQESNGKRRRDSYEIPERNVLVRVRESGRLGLHRTNAAGLSDLENAIRDALGQARLARPTESPVRASGAADPLPQLPELADPEIARMSQGRARDLLQRSADRAEIGWLGWAEGRMAVVNSRGLRRGTEATAAWLVASSGRGPGAGRAACAARSLEDLNPAAVFERSRQRHAGGGPVAELPNRPVPLVLSPEAAAALMDLLNREALGSSTFGDGALRDFLGEPVAPPSVSLSDDGTDPRGLPFPFDFLGAAKRPVPLIERGILRTPAVDERLASALDRPATPHLIAPDEALATHLFLHPGEEPDEELLRRADGGLWVTWLDAPRAFDRAALRFQARLRGVRRLENGALGAPLPDLLWEDHLPTLLPRVLGVGRTAVTAVAAGDPLFGATTAPMLAFDVVGSLRLI
jgi:predicted Zn-dependent protease